MPAGQPGGGGGEGRGGAGLAVQLGTGGVGGRPSVRARRDRARGARRRRPPRADAADTADTADTADARIPRTMAHAPEPRAPPAFHPNMTNPTFEAGEAGLREGMVVRVANELCRLSTIGKKLAANHENDIYVYRAHPLNPNRSIPMRKSYIHFAAASDRTDNTRFGTIRDKDKWVFRGNGRAVEGALLNVLPGEPKLRNMSGLIRAGTLARERRNQERQQAARSARYAEHRAAAHAAAHANPAPNPPNPAPANPAPNPANAAPEPDDIHTEDPRTCIICLTNVKTHAYSCGHFKTCGSCSASLNRCPLCRKPGRAFRIFE